MPYSDNFTPNPFNFPVPSFHHEVAAPDVDPDEGETILVAYNEDWSPVLAAACNQLLEYSSWIGDHDDKILAVNRATNLKIQLMTPVYVGEREVPAPFWDDETDVDDEAKPEDQTWYGEVTNPTAPADELTFVENAVIWILTGFVAFALLPSGPGSIAGGLFFRTVATRFTLAFNRGDVREVIRVVIDAADYTEVDTGGMSVGDIIEIKIDGLADLPKHDILLVTTYP